MKRVFTPINKKTIVIVDDDQVAVHLYREKFQRHGFKVAIAQNADSAWQTLRREPAALVIFDLCLPEANSVEVVKNIRAEFDKLPIIAFFNPYLGNLERAALEAGATKCVANTKSTPSQMVELARELLGPAGFDTESTRGESERATLKNLVGSVLAHAPEILAGLRTSHQAFAKATDDNARQAELRKIHPQLRSLCGSAGLLGFQKIARMINALEALFIELIAKPQKISPSVTRTIAQALDTLAFLFEQAAQVRDETLIAPKVAVVDDEIISRETICSALAKAELLAVSLDDPIAAQHLLEGEHFDLIFLDVEMPGLTGLQLCVKIRETATNSATPVVFVTSHSDFGSRAQSTLSGGNDFIAKPFLLVELAVKALTLLFKKNSPPTATTIRTESTPGKASEAQPLPEPAMLGIPEA